MSLYKNLNDLKNSINAESYIYNNPKTSITKPTTSWSSPEGSIIDVRKLMPKNYNVRQALWSEMKIDKVLFNGPATIIFFSDGTKSTVKITSDPDFDGYDDRESAMMYAFLKRAYRSKWKKELKSYRYALECTIPKDVLKDYSMELDNAYLRTMIDRFDREHHSNFREQISKLDYVRFLDWTIFETCGKLFIYKEEYEDIFDRINRRK